MTKEITKSYILQQIEDKFGMRDFAAARFLFDETVVPIYNIEPHLSTWEVVNYTRSIPSVGNMNFFTIPQDERWTLRSYMVIFGATGAHKASGALITVRPTLTDYIYLDLTKGQEVSYLVNLPIPVVLEPKTKIGVYIDTYVSPQELTMLLDIKREEIR